MTEKEANAMLDNGYAVVSWGSVGQLSGQATDVVTGWADAQEVFDYVRANAATWNMDPNNIVIGGRSRGSVLSWKLAHSAHPAIVGIYMYNALPQSVWVNTTVWDPAAEVTADAPLTYLVYGPEQGSSDGHTPDNVAPVEAKYTELGIADHYTLYQDMWGDFQDNNGNWSNTYTTSHYLPGMIALLETGEQPTNGYNMLLMGNSFFAPYAQEIGDLAIGAGYTGHTDTVVTRGGDNGWPFSFWNDDGAGEIGDEHRLIKATLDAGGVDILGMVPTNIDGIVNPTDGYSEWIHYALQNNPNIKVFISLSGPDFPSVWQQTAEAAGFNSMQAMWEAYMYGGVHQTRLELLRDEFPSTTFFTIPTGQATLTLKKMYDDDELLDEVAFEGPKASSLFTDPMGHQGDIIRTTGSLVWLNALYGVDLPTYSYDSGFNTDLKGIAQTIMDQHRSNTLSIYSVPTVGGVGLLTLGLTMLGLGLMRIVRR
ncbi:MAG: hypothetical protein P8M71_10630 [Pseudomonadales bacterium]|nr:hypothetical protein [Pseudomonadales bacterium]